jgi:hypothetical protein
MNGSLIQKGTIPSSVNYSNPIYRIKYTAQSYALNSSNQKKSGSDATHIACSYFYPPEPVVPVNNAINGQCSNLDTYYTSNPRNSSLSGEDLCDNGTAGSVTYSASRERWTYTCSGKNNGTSDNCIVDLEEESVTSSCRIEVADIRGTVPFSTSVLCS